MPILRIVVITMVLGGCSYHHSDVDYDNLPDATSPYGATLHLELWPRLDSESEWDVTGELLAIESNSLLLRSSDQLLRVPIRTVVKTVATRPQLPRIGPLVGLGDLSQLRRLARYPDGLSEPMLRRLLDATAQDSVFEVHAVELRHGNTSPDYAPHVHNPAAGASLRIFLGDAREAADRFAGIEAAIAEGYRRLGPSFPGMGEHWIHPGLIVRRALDPDRPPVLCYTRINGQPRLIAVAFTLPLEGDEVPPAEPFGPTAWHDHAEAVDEESLLLAHPGSHEPADGPRLAMVHIWLWLENPDGILAQNNWRLPFLQAGIDVRGVAPSAEAARGLSLWTAEPDYYERLFRAAAAPGAGEMERLEKLLEEHRERAGEWVRARPAGAPLAEADLEELRAMWVSLWTGIQQDAKPDTWRRLAILR